MRIDKVHIVDYKNLKDFTIDLDKSKMETILLGKNATGKSNFIEALVLIFKYLDLEKKPPFEYLIEYAINQNKDRVEVEFKNGSYNIVVYESSKQLEITNKASKLLKPISNKVFFASKNRYLPKYVFTYYSGTSNKLKDHFDDHQKKFYDRAKKDGITKNDVDGLRRLFYVQMVHSYFVLLAYFSFEEEENTSVQFLEEVLGITDLESILFVLNKPRWKGKGDKRFWGAQGLVEEFLKKLWDNSLSPIYNKENRPIDFRKHTLNKEILYLYVKGKKELKEIASFYDSNTDFFKALESTYISDLINEVRVKIKKKNVEGDVTFKELSEGEQQLLTVLGLLKFTKDEESLILLDEPDTHLNPLWKWKYREFLQDVVNKPETTQIIMNTHDPLVIGSLVKEEVRIFRWDDVKKKVVAEIADVDPKGLGVGGILTSELFGLPTILDKETQEKLNRKRYLQGKLQRDDVELTNQELSEYHILKADLEKFGFYEEVEDVWFKMYLAEMSKFEEFQKVEYTDEEKELLESESKKAVQRVLEKLEKEKS